MLNCTITEITLSFFRSYKQQKLIVNHDPIVLFGANGSGKTNILEAVSLLSPGRGIRKAQTDDLMKHPDNLGWKIKAQAQVGQEKHQIETHYHGTKSRAVLINDKAQSQLALGELIRLIWLVPSMNSLWTDPPNERRRFLDRMAMSLRFDHAKQILIYDRAMRERNRMLKDGIQDPAWYSAIEIQMADAGKIITNNRLYAIARILQAQEKASTTFPMAHLELVTATGALRNPHIDLATEIAENRHIDMLAGRSLIGPHRDDLLAYYKEKNILAKLCSTGEQKALLVHIILSNTRAITEDFGTPPILLLDEISAHLDTERRAALYDEICTMNVQAWMTGTEATLFDTLYNRAQYFEITGNPAGTEIRKAV